MTRLLSDMRVLVIEDEFLIAMDVEQLCLDNGAREVTIARSSADVELDKTISFDVAVLDIFVDGATNLDFAENLKKRNVPFIFASGYSDVAEIKQTFPDVLIISKPYAGSDLVQALATVTGRSKESSSA
ncbi:response regulator [Mesorhizobium sp. SB112]|uniref:response regulator n=1 Tax=Mesorhizobium sp. SB112 TaxID=3151853 RepID=UPI0032652643